MRFPHRITFTGIEESCNPDSLLELLREEPRLEFGILISGRPDAGPRYPQAAWINSMVPRLAARGIPLALHVCAEAVPRLLLEKRLKELELSVLHTFGRIQLNGRIDDSWLPGLRGLLIHPAFRNVFITQYDVNPQLWRRFPPHKSHQVLFDASGGRGVPRLTWPAPLPGIHCGYAGGLSHLTLPTELPRIAQAAQSNPYWIDMETSLRDAQDRFSLDLAHATIAAVRAGQAVGAPQGAGTEALIA